MQIKQLFIILRQPVINLVTVFSNPTKLSNHLFIFSKSKQIFSLQMMRLDQKYQTYKPYTLFGPTVRRLVQVPLAVLCLDYQLFMNDSLAANNS